MSFRKSEPPRSPARQRDAVANECLGDNAGARATPHARMHVPACVDRLQGSRVKLCALSEVELNLGASRQPGVIQIRRFNDSDEIGTCYKSTPNNSAVPCSLRTGCRMRRRASAPLPWARRPHLHRPPPPPPRLNPSSRAGTAPPAPPRTCASSALV